MYGELIFEDAITDAERFDTELTGARRMIRELAITAEAAGKSRQAAWARRAGYALDEAAECATSAFNKDD